MWSRDLPRGCRALNVVIGYGRVTGAFFSCERHTKKEKKKIVERVFPANKSPRGGGGGGGGVWKCTDQFRVSSRGLEKNWGLEFFEFFDPSFNFVGESCISRVRRKGVGVEKFNVKMIRSCGRSTNCGKLRSRGYQGSLYTYVLVSNALLAWLGLAWLARSLILDVPGFMHDANFWPLTYVHDRTNVIFVWTRSFRALEFNLFPCLHVCVYIKLRRNRVKWSFDWRKSSRFYH